eukprot:CAMPEP_0170511138 /NCGR_PEP_ID=MMETSP0208-20121228/66138_1 /TAXON_ID=197538 /ORGANISM="Strombidium inclinatum, Strain S3" /LENGTH=128 /DNA_ID=CAMNT_0010794645 /DNA_START=1048 /DNA_END=1433 /DNA_ORIENTATION=-
MVHIENNPDASDDEVDYPYVNRPVRFMIQSYRNSIGDINAPDYDVWAPEGEDDTFGYPEVYDDLHYLDYLVWKLVRQPHYPAELPDRSYFPDLREGYLPAADSQLPAQVAAERRDLLDGQALRNDQAL